MNPRPRSIRLRTYAVGFGDCLLLTVGYGSALPDGRRVRHVLVDCGSVRPAPGGPSLVEVATLIVEHCEGRLDAVVATHPQPEHINGFGTPEASEVLRALRPNVVIRPWTDSPQLRNSGPDEAAQQLLPLLTSALASRTETATLLDDWGRQGRAAFVRAGDTVDLTAELPSMTVQVLGPPGHDRLPQLVRPGAHWFALDAAGELPSLITPPAGPWTDAARMLADPGGVGAAEWLLRTLHARPASQQLEIAGAFDDLAHNTSVVLLVTVGNRTVLLPGDAQAASWAPVLDRAQGANAVPKDRQLARRLAEVAVYKVGQHGDRRATPARLRGLWERRIGSARPLVSILSSRPGRSTRGAAPLPDPGLVADLARLGPVYRTDALPDGVWWLDVEAPTSGRDPVTCSPGPVVTRSRGGR